MASRLPAFSAALLIVLAAPAALAAPTAAQRETARRLMDEGKERMKSGDRLRAVEAYQKAHDLMHVPSTGMALANAQLAAGHLVEARDVALEVVRMPRETNEPKVFEQSRKQAKDLEAALKARIPTVRIVVKGGPAQKVTVDDVEVAPLLLGEPMALNPGHHVIVGKNADGISKTEDIDLVERDVKDVELLVPVAKPAVVTAPLEQPKVVYGPTEAPSRRSATANVMVWGGFGLAAVGVVVGGVTGMMTLKKAGEVKDQCENGICAPQAQSDLDGAKTLGQISTISFVVAGVGAAIGVVGLLLPRTSAQTALHFGEARRTSLYVGPGGAALGGTF